MKALYIRHINNSGKSNSVYTIKMIDCDASYLYQFENADIEKGKTMVEALNSCCTNGYYELIEEDYTIGLSYRKEVK